MAKQQSPQQRADFQALCRENGLDATYDVWQHKQSGQWIIARTGIEKIQGHNNIGIELELCTAGPEFAVVKATATRTVKPEGKVAKKLSIQSLGSASAKNSQVTYYAEKAEKRAKSRSILQLMGFYALGVYGEDEADDFRRPVEAPAVAAALPADVREDISRADFEANADGASGNTYHERNPKGLIEAEPPATGPKSGLNVELEATIQQIIRELTSHHITPIERNKMMTGINRLTLETAQKCLANIRKTTEERTSPDALAKARLALRSFTNANASALGTEEYNRLHLRAGALTVVAVDLIAEMQAAEQNLKMPQVAAA